MFSVFSFSNNKFNPNTPYVNLTWFSSKKTKKKKKSNVVNKSRQKKTKSCLRGRCTDGLWKFDMGLLICSPKRLPGSTYFWATLVLIMSFLVSAAYVNLSINRGRQKIWGAGQKRAETQTRRKLKQRTAQGWSKKEEIGARV